VLRRRAGQQPDLVRRGAHRGGEQPAVVVQQPGEGRRARVGQLAAGPGRNRHQHHGVEHRVGPEVVEDVVAELGGIVRQLDLHATRR